MAAKTKAKPTKARVKDVTPEAPKKGKKTGKEIALPTRQEVALYGNDAATQAFNELLSGEFDELEKKYEMVGGATRSLDRISSDCLVLDLVTGGGFTPTGINQMAGMEASGKTTTVLHTIGRALTEQSVGLININDAENTFDEEYLRGIFGPKFDPARLSRMRYSDQNILESYFDYVRGATRILPDKIWIEAVGSFCYRINRDVKEQAHLADKLADRGIKPDKALSDKKFLIIPTESTSPQALLMLDSFPAMITEGADERESDESGGMSERARKLAEILPKISGRLRRKGICFLGVNQLREKPGVTYGDPIYEPMGNALKFFSAQRNRVTTRVPKNDTFKRDKEASQLNVEDNPLGGKDYYSFKEFRNTKNKAGSPFKRGWCRIWTADPDGKGHGIDPVFDVYHYLEQTGQVEGGRVGKRGFKILLPQTKGMEPINWHNFKLMVLAEKFGGPYLKALKEAGFNKPPRLLEYCWAQRGAKAVELRANQERLIAAGKAKVPGEDSGD